MSIVSRATLTRPFVIGISLLAVSFTAGKGSASTNGPTLGAEQPKIFYVSTAATTNGDLFIADLDGSNPQQITTGWGEAVVAPIIKQNHVDEATWTINLDLRESPDHRSSFLCVFPRVRPTSVDKHVDTAPLLYLFDPQTFQSQPIGSTNWKSLECGDWSPDSKAFTFSAGDGAADQVFRIDADGTNLRQLSSGLGGYSSPSWSPDGHRIAYVFSNDGKSAIFVMNADGSNPSDLFDPDTVNTSRTSSAATPALPSGAVIDPTWSPDGEHILFSYTPNLPTMLMVMDSDGRNSRPLGSLPTIFRGLGQWLSAGSCLFEGSQTSDTSGKLQLFTIGLESSAEEPITSESAGVVGDFSLSEDRSEVLFTTAGDRVAMMRVDGTGLHYIGASNSMGSPAFIY